VSPLSGKTPEARAKQLANLQPGRGAAGPGNARALKNGSRTTNPGEAYLAPIREQLAKDPTLVAEIEHALHVDVLVVERLTAFLEKHGFEEPKQKGRQPALRPEVGMLMAANEKRARRAEQLRRVRLAAGAKGNGDGGDLAALMAAAGADEQGGDDGGPQ
jgi:hypothetical protein